MARISTYALDAAINDADKLIGTDADNNNQTKNFTLEGIAEYVIDKLIDPDASQPVIPVFRNTSDTDDANATRITGSIMYQNSYPTGTQIGINGNLLVEKNATVYLNLSVAGESYLLGNVYLGTTTSDFIKQRGTLELLAPIKDSSGTLGNNEQVLVSDALGIMHWENYQGTGLEYQSAWNPETNTPDLTAIPLTGDNTGKYWVASAAGNTDLGGITNWFPGDWAIISQDNDDNVFWDKIDNSGLDGVGITNYLPKWTSSETLGVSSFYQTPDTALGTAGAISLNTTLADSTYGEVPGLRVASRVNDTPSVIDLFRNDTSVTAGESAGILQYSILDDARYTIAQIDVKTLVNSGIGNAGGGKFLFKTSRAGNGTIPETRLELDNGSADFSVPINVTTTTQSNFAGQIEANSLVVNDTALISDKLTMEDDIDMTSNGNIKNLVDPVDAQDAATKNYVDSKTFGQITGSGKVYSGAMWDGTILGAPTQDLISSPLTFRITDTGPGILQPHSIAFGGYSIATGARNSVALGYNNQSLGESSIATGHNTIASGLHSASFNYATTASGEKSAAFGEDTEATGKNSFAIGIYTNAGTSLSFAGGKSSTANPSVNGTTAFAYGTSVNATGPDSAAFGNSTEASGENSFAAGNLSIASGKNAHAIGRSCEASGERSIAIGQGSSADAYGSIAIGANNSTPTNKTNAVVIGSNLISGTAEQVVLGRNNASNLVKFVVGNGLSDTSRKNGLEITPTHVAIPDYGSGSVTGVAAYNLSVNSNGKIIETAVPAYLSAVLLISQSGNNAPVNDNVLENTLGISAPFNWTRVASGEYNLNAPGKFKLLKTIVFLNGGSAENNHDVAWEVIDADNLRIRTHNSDGKLTKASLEIRTYN